MSEAKVFTFQDVAEHNTKNDVFMVVHDKVYDCTKFLDEHPGGEEVMLDVAGQDATEAFEDVGHSDEAREALDRLYIGELRRLPGDPGPAHPAVTHGGAVVKAENTGIGMGAYAVAVVFAAGAYFGYQYLQAQAATVAKHL